MKLKEAILRGETAEWVARVEVLRNAQSAAKTKARGLSMGEFIKKESGNGDFKKDSR